MADTEEFKDACAIVKETLREYREKGIEGIQDSQLRNILIDVLSQCSN